MDNTDTDNNRYFNSYEVLKSSETYRYEKQFNEHSLFYINMKDDCKITDKDLSTKKFANILFNHIHNEKIHLNQNDKIKFMDIKFSVQFTIKCPFFCDHKHKITVTLHLMDNFNSFYQKILKIKKELQENECKYCSIDKKQEQVDALLKIEINARFICSYTKIHKKSLERIITSCNNKSNYDSLQYMNDRWSFFKITYHKI
jgi:hypothetical protein